MRKCAGGALLVAIGCIGTAEPGRTAGFQLCEQSERASATACVGQALFANTFDNPAAMTSASAAYAETSGRVILLTHKFEPSAAPLQGGGNGGDAGAPAFMPTSHLVVPIDDRVALGASLTAPYGLGLKYDSGWAGRYYVEKIALQTVNATAGVGYRLTDWLSVGGAASVQFAQARYRRKLNNVLDGLPDGTFSMALDDWAFGFNLGAKAGLSQDIDVGVTYRSRVHHELTGDASLVGVGPTLASLGVVGTRASFPLDLPDHVIADVAWRVDPTLTITAEAGWSGWGDLNSASVTLNSGYVDTTVRNWDDTYRVGVSVMWAAAPGTTLMAGASYESSPVETAFRLPDLPGDEQQGFGLGVEHSVSDAVKLSASYAYYDLGENRIDGSLDSLTGTLQGTMSETIHYLGLGAIVEL